MHLAGQCHLQEGKRYGDTFPSDAGTLKHNNSKGGPSLKAVPALILTLGSLRVMSPLLPEGTAPRSSSVGLTPAGTACSLAADMGPSGTTGTALW